jgi:vacuolar-type H+-ATPase subunit D/Vma8
MPLRIPPGRAGRTWLAGRLETAGRGAALLDRNRQALLREQARVRTEADSARRAWLDAVAQAERWTARATMLDGAGRLELLVRHVSTPAAVELSWSNLMGAALPALDEVAVASPPPLSALGASTAAVLAADAWRQATRDAARHAVAQRSDAELSAELARATRRLRALQKRWIPQHEAALAKLDLALDETQREQAARVRWLTRRTDAAGPASAAPARTDQGSAASSRLQSARP